MRTSIRWAIATAAISFTLGVGVAEACEAKHENSASTSKSVAKEIDAALADKCSCTSAGDCTCKKGSCKCDKCGQHRNQLTSPLKGQKTGALQIPRGARLDATAGSFI